MANLPVRLSEMKFEETPFGRNSRKSRIPVGEIPRKRSLSSEPRSTSKVKIISHSTAQSTNLRRSRSTLSLCGTPAATPIRLNSVSKYTPKTQTKSNLAVEKSIKINEQLNALHAYLSEMKLSVPNGSLKQMTVSQFISYIQHFTDFLTAQRIKITPLNYVQVIPKIMKSFKYTGQLSRSILIAPNTMHSWPHASSLLLWFRIVYEELYSSDICYVLDENENSKIMLKLNYICKIYNLWNEKKDPEGEMLKKECINELCALSSYSDEDEIETKILQKKHKIDQLKAVLEKKQKLYEDIERQKSTFLDLKQNVLYLEDNRQKLSDQIADLRQFNVNSKKRYESLQAEKRILLAQIKKQPMGKDHKLQLESQISEYNRKINNNKEIHQKHTAHNYDIKVKIMALDSEFDKIVNQYKYSIYNLYEKLSLLGIDFNAETLEITLGTADSESINKILTEKLGSLQNCSLSLQNELSKREQKHLHSLNKVQEMKDYMISLQKEVDTILNEDKLLKEEISTAKQNIQHLLQQYEVKKEHLENIKKNNKDITDKNKKYKIIANETVQKMFQAKESFLQADEKYKQFLKSKRELFEKETAETRHNLKTLLCSIVDLNNEHKEFFNIFSGLKK